MRNINIVLKRRKRKGRKERNMGMRRKKERKKIKETRNYEKHFAI